MNNDLLKAYIHHRRAKKSADRALALARADIAGGKNHYCSSFYPAESRVPLDRSRGVWIENLEAVGLRFVGHADKIAKRNYSYAHGIEHKGWFTSDENWTGETLRGGVWQFPARDGNPRYIAGYSDPCNQGAARLDFSSITEGEKGGAPEGASYDQTARDVAHTADSFAEKVAEKEREYDAAWRAGQDAANAVEYVPETRRELLARIKEGKAVKAQWLVYPSIRRALCGGIEKLMESIKEAREKRNEIIRDAPRYDESLRAAFNDGFGKNVI